MSDFTLDYLYAQLSKATSVAAQESWVRRIRAREQLLAALGRSSS